MPGRGKNRLGGAAGRAIHAKAIPPRVFRSGAAAYTGQRRRNVKEQGPGPREVTRAKRSPVL